MKLHSTFGAFLVAFTMVHGAPIVLESRVGRNTNMTVSSNESGPGSDLRFGGDGFAPGINQRVRNNGPPVDVIARDDTSSEDASSKQSDGIKSGSSSVTSTSQAKEGSTAAGSSTGAVAGTVSTGIISESLFRREQGPTKGGSAQASTKGGNFGSSSKAPGGQTTRDTKGLTQTAAKVVSGGSRNGFAQANASSAPFKRDTTGTEGTALNLAVKNQNVNNANNDPSAVAANNPLQAGSQSISSNGNGSSSEGVAPNTAQSSPKDKAVEGRAIRMRAKSGDSAKSPSVDGNSSPSGSSTSTSPDAGASSGNAAKKPTGSVSGDTLVGSVGAVGAVAAGQVASLPTAKSADN